MNRIGFALLASALFVSSGIAADNTTKQSHNDPYVAGPANESRIAQEVRHQLVMLPYYGIFDDLGFTINGGTVTLHGQVTQPVLKDDAGRVVKKVEGVTVLMPALAAASSSSRIAIQARPRRESWSRYTNTMTRARMTTIVM